MEILFRGQTPDGRWLYGGIMRFGDVYYISYIDDNGALHNTEIKSGTVQQYTNVDDYNLSKIFMGDEIIISDVFNEKDNRLGELKLDKDVFNTTMQQMQLIQSDMRETRSDVKNILQIVGDRRR